MPTVEILTQPIIMERFSIPAGGSGSYIMWLPFFPCYLRYVKFTGSTTFTNIGGSSTGAISIYGPTNASASPLDTGALIYQNTNIIPYSIVNPVPETDSYKMIDVLETPPAIGNFQLVVSPVTVYDALNPPVNITPLSATVSVTDSTGTAVTAPYLLIVAGVSATNNPVQTPNLNVQIGISPMARGLDLVPVIASWASSKAGVI